MNPSCTTHCLLGKPTGVICADDECDLRTGLRRFPIPVPLVRTVILKPFTRRAIALFHPVGSHQRTSKVMNHRLGKLRAWTFQSRNFKSAT